MQFYYFSFVLGLILVKFSYSLTEDDKSYLAPCLNKKYILESRDDNHVQIMQALGVGHLKRHLGKIDSLFIQLTEKDGEYTLTSDTVFKNIVTKFRIGEKFDDETPNGRKVKTIFLQNKNTLTEVQYGEKVTTIAREFTPDEVKVTIRVGDVVYVRIYKPFN